MSRPADCQCPPSMIATLVPSASARRHPIDLHTARVTWSITYLWKPCRGICNSIDRRRRHLINSLANIIERYMQEERPTNSPIRHLAGPIQEGHITLEGELAQPPYPLTERSLAKLNAAQEATRGVQPKMLAMMKRRSVGTKSVRSNCSRWTEDSVDGNNYTVDVRLRDNKGEMWTIPARVDTQAYRSVICGGTLSKMGPFTAIVLPAGKIVEFLSPIGSTTTTPTQFIEVPVDFTIAEIESMGAKLRIMEDAEDHGIILGQDFLAKYKKRTKRSLLKLVEDHGPTSNKNADRRFFGALRRVKKSPAQKAMNDVYKEQHKRSYEAFGRLPHSITATTESARLAEENPKKAEEEAGKVAIARNDDPRLPSTYPGSEDLESDDFDGQTRITTRTNTSSTQFSSIFETVSVASSAWTEVSLSTPEQKSKDTSIIGDW